MGHWVYRHSGNQALDLNVFMVLFLREVILASPRLRHSEQVCSIVSGELFSFLEKFAQDLLDRAGEMFVVFVFDICNVYEIVAYDWLYSQYWDQVKMLDMKHRRLVFDFSLLVRLIWFCEMAKLSKSVLSNFKRMN